LAAAPPLPGAAFAAAAGFIDAFVTAAAFFVLAISVSIRCKALQIPELRARFPPLSSVLPGGSCGPNAPRQLPDGRGARLHGKCEKACGRTVELQLLLPRYCGREAFPMAVLTAIDEADARALLDAYGLGPLRRVEGIAGGSVNSNFALEGGKGRVFLRLYEEQDEVGARRETAMLERLEGSGVPTPAPLRRIDGGLVSELRGKPAALFPWRDGSIRCQAGVTDEDARRVGEALARIHVAGAKEPAVEGRFGIENLRQRLERIRSSGHGVFAPLAPSLQSSLEAAHRARDPALPRGLMHGDLFRDNVLWAPGGDIAALLDFESACEGTYAYDLMVTVLSWCFGDDLDGRLASAMCEGYERVRPLQEAEKRGLAAEGSFAALRFTITRITDYAMRIGAAGPRVIKDWSRFMKRFEKLRDLGVDGVRQLLDT
jgi:homoserine kinase type II